jgi:hypothetical protein
VVGSHDQSQPIDQDNSSGETAAENHAGAMTPLPPKQVKSALPDLLFGGRYLGVVSLLALKFVQNLQQLQRSRDQDSRPAFA